MKRATILILLSLLLCAISYASASLQNDAKSGVLAGTWDCIAHGSVQGDVSFTMKLQQDKDTLTGSITTDDGDMAITSGSYKDGVIEILIDAPDAKYTVKGKLDGSQLSGQWTGEGDDGKQGGAWEGKRSTTAPAAPAPSKPAQ